MSNFSLIAAKPDIREQIILAKSYFVTHLTYSENPVAPLKRAVLWEVDMKPDLGLLKPELSFHVSDTQRW